MSKMTKSQNYHLSTSFKLTPEKLLRIIEVGREQYKALGFSCAPQITVTHKNGRQLITDDPSEVFGLDNTVKNPIALLEVNFFYQGTQPSLDSGIVLQSESEMIFVGEHYCRLEFEDSDFRTISLTVLSSDAKWARGTCDAFSEQLNRLSVKNIFRMNKLYLALLGALVAAMFGVFSAYSSLRDKNLGRLSNETIVELSRAQPATLEEKIDFIYRVNREEIAKMSIERSSSTIDAAKRFAATNKARAIFISFPIILFVSCIFYLAVYCYPRCVYYWGDYKEHYDKIVSRRWFIWTAVIASTVLGVIGNLFVNSFSI